MSYIHGGFFCYSEKVNLKKDLGEWKIYPVFIIKTYKNFGLYKT